MENNGYRDMQASAPPSYDQVLHDASSSYPKDEASRNYLPGGFQSHPATMAPGPYPATYPNPPYPSTYQNPYPPTSNAPVYPPNSNAPILPVSYAAPYPGPKYPTAYDGSAYTAAPTPVNHRGDSEGLIADAVVTVVPNSGDDGVEDSHEQWSGASFTDKAIRRRFIQKVFLILMAQLSVTVGFICLFIFCEPVKDWVTGTGIWFYLCAYVTFLVTYIVLVCCPSVRRQFPGNFICLGIFTLALSYMTGTISSVHSTNIVLIAIAITAAVCLSLTIFALQTRIDFTMCSGLIFAFCMVVFFFGLATIIGGAFMSYQSAYILNCVYGALAALLFSLFLVYDIQNVMGDRKYSLSPEEYIFGALQIYLDVVYLFIIILSLFGGRK